MKNKLIILTSTIGRMGGAQKYVENKVNYFQSRGWDVYVFYFLYAEKIMLPGMEQFRGNYIPDLQFPIQHVPEFRKRKIISDIRSKVHPDNSAVVVESQISSSVYWGELIAESFSGRNVLNLLEEQLPELNEREYLFFEYKLKRGDFLNAAPDRLRKLFKNRFKDEHLQYSRQITIPCANVVSTDVDYKCDFVECDYMILSIGRLDKPYVPVMNEQLQLFANEYRDKKINIVFIGGSKEGIEEERIPQLFEELDNVHCYILGYIYPIPQSLIKRANVAIACANSVLVSSNEGVPTIVVDVNDYSAIGIYGYTTSNKFKRTTEKVETISNLLKQVLIKHAYHGGEMQNTLSHDNEKAFEDDITFFLEQHDKQYYAVQDIYSKKEKVVSQLKYFVIRIRSFIKSKRS